MAQPLICDECQNNMADFMVSAIGTGDVVAICRVCILQFAVGITSGVEGHEALWEEAVAFMSPPKPKAGRKAKAAAPVVEETDEPTDEPEPVEPEPVEVS
jgi:hypothetical protein